ncbi:hypothetical protein B0H13DRAFT_2361038 [Mycena leptocephala]|nr:hypothetical protein B0H13DRAFT_2361038 [Mycena leptocephala]
MLRPPPPCAERSLSPSPPRKPATVYASSHTTHLAHTPASRTPSRTSAGIDPLTSTHSDLHRCISAHFPCYLTAPTSHRTSNVARNSSLSFHARHQSWAVSSPSSKYAHGALPEQVQPETQAPATITDPGTHARLSSGE